MSQFLAINYETEADRAEIRSLLLAAFPTAAEADLVDRLRSDADVLLALVAKHATAIVGSIVFSQVRAPFVAVGLAPLAVRADRRKRGISSALIEAGLGELSALGVEAVFVVGDPRYYARFGFDAAAAAGFKSSYAGPHFMIRKLTSAPLAATTGEVEYAAAFAALT
jgi:putative acetyltransferase